MTEAELGRAVRELLAEHRLYGYHVPDSRQAARAGFPDWVILGRRVLWRELKDETDQLRPDQRRVRNLLLASGADWALWRPSDLRGGRIAAELAAIA